MKLSVMLENHENEAKHKVKIKCHVRNRYKKDKVYKRFEQSCFDINTMTTKCVTKRWIWCIIKRYYGLAVHLCEGRSLEDHFRGNHAVLE